MVVQDDVLVALALWLRNWVNIQTLDSLVNLIGFQQLLSPSLEKENCGVRFDYNLKVTELFLCTTRLTDYCQDRAPQMQHGLSYILNIKKERELTIYENKTEGQKGVDAFSPFDSS